MFLISNFSMKYLYFIAFKLMNGKKLCQNSLFNIVLIAIKEIYK